MRLILLSIVVVATALLVFRAVRPSLPSRSSTTISPRPLLASGDETHYAPFENLEALDYQKLAEAKEKIDIAMYAMTDRYLATELTRLADRGITIRLYRDGEQWQEEMRHGRGDTIQDFLRGHAHIQVRVKPPSRRDLMHLKAYVIDGRLLRDGSANWSPAGLREQDADLRFTSDPREIEAFESRFDEMWKRTSNLYVQ